MRLYCKTNNFLHQNTMTGIPQDHNLCLQKPQQRQHFFLRAFWHFTNSRLINYYSAKYKYDFALAYLLKHGFMVSYLNNMHSGLDCNGLFQCIILTCLISAVSLKAPICLLTSTFMSKQDCDTKPCLPLEHPSNIYQQHNTSGKQVYNIQFGWFPHSIIQRKCCSAFMYLLSIKHSSNV